METGTLTYSLSRDSTCPDWSNPCKHIAAVFYLLGEEFDRDPFLMFRMRGITREAFLALMGEEESSANTEDEEKALPPEPLMGQWASFWAGGVIAEDLFGDTSPRL